MNITNYLKKFFVENNVEAAIPSLGVFYVESQIGAPVPVILFKEKLPKSKVFLNFVAFEENLTEQEALDGIEDWVKDILKDLKASGVVNIASLGTFEIVEGKVEFLPSPEQFSSDDIFGLENKEQEDLIVVEEESKVQPKKTKKQKISKRKLRYLLLIVLIVLVAVLAVWFILPIVNDRIAPKDPIEITLNEPDADAVLLPEESEAEVLNTEAEDALIAKAVVEGEVKKMEQKQSKGPEVKAKSIENKSSAKVESKETKSSAEVKSKTVPTQTNTVTTPKPKVQSKENTGALRYYIIADAFAVKENADKRKRELNDKAYTVEILHNAQKNLYMVSVKSFVDMDEALNFKAMVRDQKGIPCWIYKK